MIATGLGPARPDPVMSPILREKIAKNIHNWRLPEFLNDNAYDRTALNTLVKEATIYLNIWLLLQA